MRPLRGLLNLKKPTGMTSRDVVDLIARPLRRDKVKVGHAGTLDPLASGVLVVAVGVATRLIEYVQESTKTYRARVRLGATSDSDDADGAIIEATDPPKPTRDQVLAALQAQVGMVLQRPPRVSALKVQGRRAYDLARQGAEVVLAPRPVRIDDVVLQGYDWPWLEIDVVCGGGTYIRAIARDVGEALGCGGMVQELQRTRIGAFTIAEALDPQAITWTPETIAAHLLPANLAVADLPAWRLTDEQVGRVARGQPLRATHLGGPGPSGGLLALLDGTGELVALAEFDVAAGAIQPRRVLIGAP